MESIEFKSELSALIPHLRAFARNLCNDATQADDLAQETLLRAWKARESYQEGTNLKAWAFTILRNTFYSEKRRSWRRQPLDPEVAEATLVANDDASASMELLALRNAMNRLPDDQREALILVGAGGMPYEEVAEICGCAVGTIKSRVNRARNALAVILETNEAGFSSDANMSADDVFDDLISQADKLSGPTPA
ncbi:sigma-70 family RNA polymerase sigma factor [Ponticaulis sp.]|uniref:sigma-70 family RNA polymerase sigma factor n=1 Tax=Ponticaulis sp. TaxID=2020902 RepID=UPI0025CBB013|nr:sigma-70 family RNA polymerase sigma factor [Ponticaulis sp.]